MSGVYFLSFLKVIFRLSPFEKLHHSLFYLPALFLTFFSNTMFQMNLRPFFNFFLGSIFLIHKQQYAKYNFFMSFFFISKLRLYKQSSCFLLLNITLTSLIRCIISSFSPSSIKVLSRYLNFGTCFRASSSILIFSGYLEQTTISGFDMNTSLKSVPGTPHVLKLERHEISSNLFRKTFHDVIVRSGPV